MEITRLTEFDKSKVKVYLEDEYAFWLTSKDVEQLALKEGADMTEAVYQELLRNTIYPRAKQKALSILKYMDRTEQELRQKLSDADYSEDAIDVAITYVNGYGYLNDTRLASSYTRARMNRKSKLVIKMELLQKGVSSDIIQEVFSDIYSEDPEADPEAEAIRKAIAKKSRFPHPLEQEEKQKLIASLCRKGYDIGKIKKIMDHAETS